MWIWQTWKFEVNTRSPEHRGVAVVMSDAVDTRPDFRRTSPRIVADRYSLFFGIGFDVL